MARESLAKFYYILLCGSRVSATNADLWGVRSWYLCRVFGLKATKGKATIDGKRNCFRCVEVSISSGMLELVSMWTIYDRRCAPHRRVEVSLVAALSLANDNEHVDTGGRASEALNSHECWRVFCDVMASDGQLQFSVPDAVITALNREHRKEALLGADFQLKERLLNAASLVVSSTPGTMWKALQKIARVFGLKATRANSAMQATRNSPLRTESKRRNSFVNHGHDHADSSVIQFTVVYRYSCKPV